MLEKFENKLQDSPQNIKKAAIELAKLWRTDRMLRRLESLLIVADRACTLIVSGNGDVIEPSDGVAGIGSGSAGVVAAHQAEAAGHRAKRHADCRPVVHLLQYEYSGSVVVVFAML